MKIIKKEYIEQGLTNNNYLLTLSDDSKIVHRIPKNHNLNFDYKNEEKIIKLIQPLNISVKELYFNNKTGEKYSEYIDNYSYFNNKSKKQLKEIALTLKKLHSLKVDFDFKMFDKLNEFKKNNENLFSFEENILDLLRKYQKDEDMVLCHNDLVKGNLLFKDKLYLIDYEYASNNYKEFDLASLLSENNIESINNIKYFLNCYYDKEINNEEFIKVITYYIFEDMLWSYWAINFYKLEHKQIYKNIYNQKSKRANKFYNLYLKK